MYATNVVIGGLESMYECMLFKHTITLLLHYYIIIIIIMSDQDILSREWRVIVHQVQTNYNDRHMVL